MTKTAAPRWNMALRSWPNSHLMPCQAKPNDRHRPRKKPVRGGRPFLPLLIRDGVSECDGGIDTDVSGPFVGHGSQLQIVFPGERSGEYQSRTGTDGGTDQTVPYIMLTREAASPCHVCLSFVSRKIKTSNSPISGFVKINPNKIFL